MAIQNRMHRADRWGMNVRISVEEDALALAKQGEVLTGVPYNLSCFLEISNGDYFIRNGEFAALSSNLGFTPYSRCIVVLPLGVNEFVAPL
jgi:hypothetical protein